VIYRAFDRERQALQASLLTLPTSATPRRSGGNEASQGLDFVILLAVGAGLLRVMVIGR